MITTNARLLLTVLMAFVLTILPLPDMLSGFRPQWILLIVLYIQFFLPNYFSVTFIFFLGLCLDVLLSTILGEHAFALLLTSWFAVGRTRRFIFFSTLQQMALIAIFGLIYQGVLYLMDASLGHSAGITVVPQRALLSMLLWPWIKWVGSLLLPSKTASRY